jgi:ribokinase
MITVFGSINLDLVLRVATHPRPGETVTGAERSQVAGGKGANQALAAARAGAGVRLVGAVGSDGFAGAALGELRAAGVDLAHVAHREGPTGLAVIVVDAGGENAIVVAPGVNLAVTAEQAAAVAFAAGDTLMLQLEVPYSQGRVLAERAAEQGGRVILSVAPFGPLSAADVAPVTILVMNQHEAIALARHLGIGATDAQDSVHQLAKALGKTVIATLGPEGAIAAEGDRIVHVPALAVTPVDTTGAGDAFAGVLAARLDAGADLKTAMTAAAVAGSLATTRPGAQPSFPKWPEIELALGRVRVGTPGGG